MYGILDIYRIAKEEINEMIQEYYKNLIAPMDDMWESAIIGISNYYRIVLKYNNIGYFCLDTDNVLLQYFIKDMYIDKSKELLKYILMEYKIEEGFISTADTRNMPLFLDFNNELTTHTFLYKDICCINNSNPIENIEIMIATPDNLQNLIDYHENSVDIKGSWLKPYLINLIKKQQLFLFILNDKIIGTGERRNSQSQKEYANIGVTVSKNYRRKGLASYILSYLKDDCYKYGLIPICSTTIENIGSQKAIQNSGFFPYHRIAKIKFRKMD